MFTILYLFPGLSAGLLSFQYFRPRMIFRINHRPRNPEIRYPMRPSTGNPNKNGRIPVVITIEDPTIMAAIMMPSVRRLVMLSRVFIRPPRFSCLKPIVNSPLFALSSINSMRPGISFCMLKNRDRLNRISRNRDSGLKRSIASLEM